MIIREVHAHAIRDSRREPTIEVSINNEKASSPSGKSTGKYETPCYHNSLEWNIKAINNINELKELEIESFSDLSKVEKLIKKKFKLKDAKQFGANALFALESAILKALAKSQGRELWQIINEKARSFPRPVGNVIGGGLHSEAKNHPTFQEFPLIPKGRTFKEQYKNLESTYSKIEHLLKSKSIDYEGAIETSLNEEQILEVLSKFKNKIDIGTDIAASSFYKNGNYCYNNKCLDRKMQIEFVNAIIDKFKLLYVEDPLEENDFQGFSKIDKRKCLIVGDDLTATHIQRLKRAIKAKAINAMIVKPNQNGSLLELKEIIDFCKKKKIKTILSHRAGETLDSALADYAFGFQCDFIKCGIATVWRESKLQRLLEIERSL